MQLEFDVYLAEAVCSQVGWILNPAVVEVEADDLGILHLNIVN